MKNLLTLVLILMVPFFLSAQANLIGYVHCTNGSPVEGIVVNLGNYSDTTNTWGYFSFLNVPAGDYILEVVIPGAWPVTYNITLISGETMEADVPVSCGDFTVSPDNLEVVIEPNTFETEILTLSNSGPIPVNWSATINFLENDNSDDLFDLILQEPLTPSYSESGIESDGDFIYTSSYASNIIRKYDLMGNYISEFTIPGEGAIQEITWDGEYFYGSNGMTLIMILDFETQSLVGTFDAPMDVRAIAYDWDNDVFYGYSWQDYIVVFDHQGTLINLIPGVPGLSYISGFVYDNFSDGGPYLWAYGQLNTDHHMLVQLALPGLLATGISVNMEDLLGNLTPPSGGLFACQIPNIGIWMLGGLVRYEWMWGVEIASFNAWLTVEPSSGTVPGGGTQDVQVIFNAENVLPWTYHADVIFSTTPNTGSPVVNTSMSIYGEPAIGGLIAENSCTDVILDWQVIPPGTPVDSFHVYRDGTLLATTYENHFEDLMLIPESNHSYFATAYFFNGWESNASNTEQMAVPLPDNLEPANLNITYSADSIVCFSWENNACLEPDYYMVYQGLLLIDMVTEPYYCDTLEYPGDYYFYVSSEFYFGSGWSEMVYYTWDPVTVPEENAPSFSLFPNPATDFVFLRHPKLPETVTLYNAMGEKVMFVSNPKSNRFDISSFERGIYFLVTEYKNSKQNTRLIIQ